LSSWPSGNPTDASGAFRSNPRPSTKAFITFFKSLNCYKIPFFLSFPRKRESSKFKQFCPPEADCFRRSDGFPDFLRELQSMNILIVLATIVFFLLSCYFSSPLNAFPPVSAGLSPGQEFENALTLFKKKEYLPALQALRRLEENHPESRFQPDALFVQGKTLRALQRWPEAAQVFSRAAEVHTLLADYALYYQGESLQMAKEGRKSLEVWQRLINLYPKSLRAPQAELKMAEIYFQLGEYSRSAEVCEALLKKSPRKDYSAQALFFLGQAQEGLRQWAKALQSYQEVWLSHPLHPAAKIAKDRLETLIKEKKLPAPKIPPAALLSRALHFYQARLFERTLNEMERLEGFPANVYPQNYAGEPWVDELYFHRGMCFFYLKQYSKAVETFNLLVHRSRNEDMADKSLFWMTRALFRAGRKENALNTFSLFQNTYPQSPFMDRALYLKAQIFDEREDITQAVALYRELAEKFPQSSLRFQALWQSGWLLFNHKDLQGAIQAWDRLQALNPNSPWVEKVLYWKGRALQISGISQEAEENFQLLLKNYPASYYSLLAANREGSFRASRGFSTFLHDQVLGSFLEIKGPSSRPGSVYLEKGSILTKLGILLAAVEELEAAEEEGRASSEMQKEVSRLYREAGEYHRSALLIRKNFSLKPLAGRLPENERTLYLLAYPLGSSSWVNHYARSRNLDAALLSAVILEESRFNPQALSVAGARGLMQIMPRTGQQIAKRLKMPSFSEGLLFDPEANLSLGSWYLASLLEEFGGREALALAAYNAGPHIVREWLAKKNWQREDEFVENIPYSETKNYVIQVLRSARIYQALYAFPQSHSGS